MASATSPIADQSSSIVRKNMTRIKLFTVAGPLLCHAAQANRVVRLLENRRSWSLERPLGHFYGGKRYVTIEEWHNILAGFFVGVLAVIVILALIEIFSR